VTLEELASLVCRTREAAADAVELDVDRQPVRPVTRGVRDGFAPVSWRNDTKVGRSEFGSGRRRLSTILRPD
jgi:hypothetical protein